MAEIADNKFIEKLGGAVALWGSLAGGLLWVAVLFLRRSFGLVELGVLLVVPILCGVILRVIARLL